MKITVFLACFASGWSTLFCAERRFPNDFLFGASTSSYQTEGAWNEYGKGESIWDHFTHTKPGAVIDYSNGDIAADSYHNYKRDVEMMRELGLNAYRFSISWPRLLPSGFTDQVNPYGVKFYNNFIDEMLKYNITPFVTLYHWDLPQRLQDIGGLTNPFFIDWFEDYARVVFRLFGGKVKHWITFNEPKQHCFLGYSSTVKAPAVNGSSISEYQCAKVLLLAHARAYHAYKNDFKPIQRGECGITFNIFWVEPATQSKEDMLATELFRQSDWIMYTDPIYSKHGGFPRELRRLVKIKSKEEGYRRSRLPAFSSDEKVYVRGTSDFMGINYYSSFAVSASKYFDGVPYKYNDINVGYYTPEDWFTSDMNSMALAPSSLYKTLVQVMDKYDNPKVYITENGWPSTIGLNDSTRISYYRFIWEDCLDAIHRGVNLKGYMLWSMFDNFEWESGFAKRFGLYQLELTPARARIPRKSAFVYKEVIRSRIVDHNYEPYNIYNMTIDEGH